MPVLYRKYHSKGFTLVEVVLTLAIMMVLSGIAIPLLNKYMQKGYDAEISADAKNAYTASQAWLSDNPGGTVNSLAKLLTGGYRSSKNISWGTGNMTTSSGSIVLLSAAAVDTRNVATIIFNGNINIAP